MMSDIISPEWVLRRQRSEPLPHLLAEYLKEAIRGGKLIPGQRLPGENELARQLGVSRTTLRAAVEMLLANKILERRHGVGTFVASSSLMMMEEGLESLISTSTLIRHNGYEPGTTGFHAEPILASRLIAKMLEIPERSQILHLSRTRTANHKPVMQAEEYVPVSILSPQAVPDGCSDWSLYELLKESGSPIMSAVCRIKAIGANGLLARQLKVPARFPLLLLSQTHFDAEHRPVLYCENYHNSSIIDFQVLRHS